jgi:WXG100 family type VII secretion target
MTNTLSTDLDLMRSVAAATDSRNAEIRAMLQTFIGRMSSVPHSVWGGAAATRFKEVVDRWTAESVKLHQALHGIAQTIRLNEAALREAAEDHAHHISATGRHL